MVNIAPLFRVGAPSCLVEAAGRLRYAVWINARTDISMRIIGAAYRLQMPDLVDKAFHVLALELQDAAVTKLDALYDKKSNDVCIPNIISTVRTERSWLSQKLLTIEMLLQQIDEHISSITASGSLKRIKRWRNDEAGHIVWTSDKFQDEIYADVIEVHDVTCKILRDLVQLIFAIDVAQSYFYRSSLAEAMSSQLLRGRLAQD